jgi:pre-rRNA-processing protein IPI3
LKEHAFFVPPVSTENSNSSAATNSASLQSRVQDLEYEVEQLRMQLGKAKGVNDAMWDTVVQRLVDQDKTNGGTSSEASEDPEESKRNRKRGRTGN